MINGDFGKMTLDMLVSTAMIPKTFWYLCTPYARYAGGKDLACYHANEYAGVLIRAGVPVFAPISHSHPIAKQCEINPDDYETWMNVDLAILRGSSGLLIAPFLGWRDSKGIAWEIDTAKELNLPIYMVDLRA